MRLMNKLWLKIVLIVIGVGLLSGGIYYYFHAREQAKYNDPDAIIISDKSFLDENVISNEKEQVSGEYSLSISKLDLNAPIILNVDGNNKETYMRALEGGVAHLKNSASPGEAGNTVIFGHSSYFLDKPGNYKQIFTNLNNLESKDTIEIKSKTSTFRYMVSTKSVVKPQEVSVVSQDLNKKELTLITCWPINSTEKRLVIKADLVK